MMRGQACIVYGAENLPHYDMRKDDGSWAHCVNVSVQRKNVTG